MKKKYQIMLIGLSMMLVLCLFIATSYAFWTVNVVQTDENVISSGCFDATLRGNNAINLQNSYPITDSEGLALQGYTFTVTNTCTITQNFVANLEVLNTTTIERAFIKVAVDSGTPSLLNNLPLGDKVLDEALEARTIASGVIGPEQSKEYRLNVWLDENATLEDAADKLFDGKVVVTITAVASDNTEGN